MGALDTTWIRTQVGCTEGKGVSKAGLFEWDKEQIGKAESEFSMPGSGF